MDEIQVVDKIAAIAKVAPISTSELFNQPITFALQPGHCLAQMIHHYLSKYCLKSTTAEFEQPPERVKL